jgi:uncharacterized protein YdeI (BOF family)
MDEKKPATGTDEQYEETTHPRNPPESILRREARTGWLLSSVGTIAVIFIVVAAAFGWVYVRHELGSEPQIYPDPRARGTSGEQQAREGTPGGFNPSDGAFSNTGEELKFRGATGPAPGPTDSREPAPGEVTSVSDLKNAPIGSRVLLSDVTVDRTSGSMFWVREGDSSIVVTVPGDVPTVRAGQRVDISGTVESVSGGTGIRATRIGVR